MTRRRLGPLAVAAAALACTGVGTVLARTTPPAPGPEPAGAELATPVLSPRRVPEVIAAPVAERRLEDALAAWVDRLPPDNCLVVEDEHRQVLFEHRGEEPVVPASTQKLLVATVALAELGPATTLETTVAAAEAIAPDGSLAGDLVLVGGGDPLLSTPEYRSRYRRPPTVYSDLGVLADRLVAAGLARVEGAVLGDGRRYDAATTVATWPARYGPQDVVGPLGALLVNDGWAEHPTAPGTGADLVPAQDPAAHAAAVFARLLADRGVEVLGGARAGEAPEGAAELASLPSPPMTELARELLRESDNETAELLLKELGLAAGTGATTAGGADALRAALAADGFDLDGVEVVDGSGLDLGNRVTCDLLVDLLRDDETGAALVESLPRAGSSGTLERRFTDTGLVGRLAAKTGSLNSVTALAGVVEDDDGTLTFAHVANVPEPGVVGRETVFAQEELGRLLLEHPRRPDLDALGPLPVPGG